MKNKRIYIITVLLIFAGVICFILFTNNNKLFGEWKISGFYINDELHSFDELGEYFGTDNAEAYSYYSVVFKNDKQAILTIPTYREDKYRTVECDYSIKDNIIVLSNIDETINAFKINGEILENVELLSFDVVWSKQ